MLTCELDPTTLRFVMLTDSALMTILGDLRGLPGPRRMSFSRIAAASAARSRSCFVRCASLLAATSFCCCSSCCASKAALASVPISDILGKNFNMSKVVWEGREGGTRLCGEADDDEEGVVRAKCESWRPPQLAERCANNPLPLPNHPKFFILLCRTGKPPAQGGSAESQTPLR